MANYFKFYFNSFNPYNNSTRYYSYELHFTDDDSERYREFIIFQGHTAIME